MANKVFYRIYNATTNMFARKGHMYSVKNAVHVIGNENMLLTYMFDDSGEMYIDLTACKKQFKYLKKVQERVNCVDKMYIIKYELIETNTYLLLDDDQLVPKNEVTEALYG